MNWKIGQKLVCVEYPKYPDGYPCPKKGDEVTFDGVWNGGIGIYLKEYTFSSQILIGGRITFWPHQFRPVNGLSAKSELIEKFIEVEEKSDCPIQVPEHA